MKKITYTNFAIFIIFFGAALVEAINAGNWISSAVFLILGILFLKADIPECKCWGKIEDSKNPYIRTLRIFLLVLIIVGIWLIFNRDAWVPKVVDYVLS